MRMSNTKEDSSYLAYYKDVGRYQILSAAEERALFTRYHTCSKCASPFPFKVKRANCPTCNAVISTKSDKGVATCTTCLTKFEVMIVPVACVNCGTPRDLAARDKLIVSNLRFVIKRAQTLTADSRRRDLLISAGNVGLLIAVDKYNPSLDTRFLTYAEWWIRKEMFDAINGAALVHIPPQKRRAILKKLREGKYVCIHCGVHATNEYDQPTLACTEEMHKFELPDISTSSLLGNGISLEKLNLTNTEDLERSFISDDSQILIRQTLRNMTISERDKYILMGYYNVAHTDRKSEPKNLGQLAVLLGITPERVRQVKKTALDRLKRELRRHSLEPSTTF
jgi:RNA polymerase sigma factor (sigma-70 family)